MTKTNQILTAIGLAGALTLGGLTAASAMCMGGPCSDDGAGSPSGDFTTFLGGGNSGQFQALGIGQQLDHTTTYAMGTKEGATVASFDFADPNFCDQSGGDCPEQDASLQLNFDAYENVTAEAGAKTEASGNEVAAAQQLQAMTGGTFTIASGGQETGFQTSGGLAMASEARGVAYGDEVYVDTSTSGTGAARSQFSLHKAPGECILCEDVVGSGGINGHVSTNSVVTALGHQPGQSVQAVNQNSIQLEGNFGSMFSSGAQ